MQPADLAARLVRKGALRAEGAKLALRRHRIYGGGLDTILLELGLVEEPELWRELVEGSGLPPLPPAMLEGPVIDPELMIDVATARRLGGLPLASRDGEGPIVDVIVRSGYDAGGVRAAIGAERHRFYIVPEPRFIALLGAFYGEPVPPRILSLLGRLMGAEQVRRWAATQTTPAAAPQPPVVATELRFDSRRAPASVVKARAAPPPPVEEARPAPPPVVEEPIPAVEESPAVQTAEPAPAQAPVETDVVAAEPLPAPGDVSALLDAYALLRGSPHAAEAERRLCASVGADQVAATLPVRAAIGDASLSAALELLGRGHAWSAAALEALLGSADVDQQRWAALALAFGDATGFETRLAALARDPEERVAVAALKALRRSTGHAVVSELATRLREDVGDPDGALATRAITQVAALRDGRAVPALIERLGDDEGIAAAARQALVSLTGHDAGTSQRRWRAWWRDHESRHRIEWLIEGLESTQDELRLVAAHELREATGEYFGYAFDLPPRERQEARKRWESWWQERGRARFGAG